MSGERPLHRRCGQVSDEIWAMLRRCWVTDPNWRPSMVELDHFFADLIMRKVPFLANRKSLAIVTCSGTPENLTYGLSAAVH
jgi:hypothetical protein